MKIKLILSIFRSCARIDAKNISQITTLKSLRKKFLVTIVLRMKSESRTLTTNKLEFEAR